MFSKYLVMDDWLNQARHLNPLLQDNNLWKKSSDMLGSHLSLNMTHHDLSAGLSGERERDVHTHTHTQHMHDSSLWSCKHTHQQPKALVYSHHKCQWVT